MYTNGNVGNTFDQYTISYILLGIIIIIIQEVNITCPVFTSTLIISVKRTFLALWSAAVGLVEFSTMIAMADLVLSVVHSSTTKMKLQTITPSETPPRLQLDVHWPQKSWMTHHQQLHALEIAEAKRACQHQLE